MRRASLVICFLLAFQLMTDHRLAPGFGWRAIFAFNLPIVVVVLIVLRRSVPASVDEQASLTDETSGSKPTRSNRPRLANSTFVAAFSTQAMAVFAQYSLLLVCPILLDARGWGTGAIGVALSALLLGMIVMSPIGQRHAACARRLNAKNCK